MVEEIDKEQDKRLSVVETAIKLISEKLDNICEDIKEIKDKLDNKYVSKIEFEGFKVSKIEFEGFKDRVKRLESVKERIGWFIVLAVLTALVSLVLIK